LDWKKAKEILIAMFLIINIFLSYQLYTISRNQYEYINQEELQNVIQYLNKKNIQLETEIPDRVLILPSVRAKYHEFDSKEIEKIFFDSKEVKLEGTAVKYRMGNENISIDVKSRIYLTYNNKGIEIPQEDVDKEKCLNHAYRFLDKLKINSGNRYVKQEIVKKGYVRLILGQQFNKIPVEESQIEIYATEEGVVQATVNWFEWIKNDKKHNIITPVIALLKVFEQELKQEAPVTVKEIRQGYYYSPETSDGAEDIDLEVAISPMWVISSNRGETYVNAYNENIEKRR
jgi:regulatory protein YycI of two-component signal transduction system YycFG